MPERNHQVGRVVFRDPKEEWVVLTLNCHVRNVVRLVQLWDAEKAYLHASGLDQTKEWTVTAAQVHDDAKPSHFRLTYQGFRGGRPRWGYSFAGHRFAVTHKNLYVELLAQLHHEYSVKGITEAVARLKLEEGAYKRVAENFPLDLYTLEMADQIEATVARAAVDAQDPEERVFMDFVFSVVDASAAAYRIDPFPFVLTPVSLEIEYATLQPLEGLRVAVENSPREDRRKHLRDVERWLLSALQKASIQTKEITLWPWV